MDKITQQDFKIVYVLTHTPSGTLSTLHVNSLATTTRYCMLNGIKVFPMYLGHVDNGAMVRNELITKLAGIEYSSVVLIDHDLGWDPVTFYNIVTDSRPVVALPAIKKVRSSLIFDLDAVTDVKEITADNYIKANFASIGFMKLSKDAVDQLLDTNVSVTNTANEEIKNVFECETSTGKFFNESIVVCNKLKALGYTIWVNISSTCAQVTQHLYAADFTSTFNTSPDNTVDDVKSLYE